MTQAVERGLLELDQPAGEIIPQLGDLEVLDSIDESGPTLRPPNNAVTLRNLLTHTSGFTYEVWNRRYSSMARTHRCPRGSWRQVGLAATAAVI